MKKTMLFIGSVIILIISAVTFIFIPAMSDGLSQKALVFGKYGNKKIEYKQGTEFANAVANYSEMYRNQGQELNDTAYFYIYNYAFNSAVQAVAYAESVKKSGYFPSEKAISRAMLPYFSDEDGNYSQAIYNSIPQEDIKNLRSQISKSFVWNRYSEDLLGSQAEVNGHKMFGLKSSQKELEFLAKMGAEKHSFDMAVFNKADYPVSEVKAYAQENKEKFSKFNLSIISVKEASQAKKVLNQIKNNEITFADAVNEYSDKAYSGSDGLITTNFGYQISEMLKNEDSYEQLSSLKSEELSDVIETNAGFAIFRCNLEKTEANIDDEATLASVKDYITEREVSKIEDFYIQKAESFKNDAQNSNFERACFVANCKYVSVPAFPLNYDNSPMFETVSSDVKELSSALTNENFLQTAFSLKEGEVSSPVVLGESVVVLKSTGIQNDSVTDEMTDSISSKVAEFDSSASQTALFNSDKVENKVSEVFFNEIMANNQ